MSIPEAVVVDESAGILAICVSLEGTPAGSVVIAAETSDGTGMPSKQFCYPFYQKKATYAALPWSLLGLGLGPKSHQYSMFSFVAEKSCKIFLTSLQGYPVANFSF